MKKSLPSFPSAIILNCLAAFFSTAVITIPMILIGRNTLGDAVIALLYLLPVGWSAARWGQGSGVCAAVTAALLFDFFFIPPFFTFAVDRLESWLVLAIFLIVSIVVIGRIQTGLTKAYNSEREARFMYELSAALAGLRTQEAVIHAVARNLQLMLQAELVEVCVQPVGKSQPILAAAPTGAKVTTPPDRIMPILASPGLLGEIRIWRGFGWLPEEGSRLFSNFATQAAQALERAYLAEAELLANSPVNKLASEG